MIPEKKEKTATPAKTETPPPAKTETPPPPKQTTAPIRADPTIPDTGAHRIMLEKRKTEKKVAKDNEEQ